MRNGVYSIGNGKKRQDWPKRQKLSNGVGGGDRRKEKQTYV